MAYERCKAGYFAHMLVPAHRLTTTQARKSAW